jgi:cysteine synthase A
LQSISISPSIAIIKAELLHLVIDDAERLGYLRPHTGSRIFEGTVGSTGISLATIARARLVIHS